MKILRLYSDGQGSIENTGTGPLTINSVSPLAAPFYKLTDTCNGIRRGIVQLPPVFAH